MDCDSFQSNIHYESTYSVRLNIFSKKMDFSKSPRQKLLDVIIAVETITFCGKNHGQERNDVVSVITIQNFVVANI